MKKVLIYDDTYEDIKFDYPTKFFHVEPYNSLIKIISYVRGNLFNNEKLNIQSFDIIAFHTSMRFLDKSGENFLDSTTNEAFLKKMYEYIHQEHKYCIKFSGSTIENKSLTSKEISVNKRFFYTHLKDFVDYSLENNNTDLRVLLSGKNYISLDLSTIQAELTKFGREVKDTNAFIIKQKDKLLLFNSIAKVKNSNDEWLNILGDQASVNKIIELLDKITLSYLKYGKCIYNL